MFKLGNCSDSQKRHRSRMETVWWLLTVTNTALSCRSTVSGSHTNFRNAAFNHPPLFWLLLPLAVRCAPSPSSEQHAPSSTSSGVLPLLFKTQANCNGNVHKWGERWSWMVLAHRYTADYSGSPLNICKEAVYGCNSEVLNQQQSDWL